MAKRKEYDQLPGDWHDRRIRVYRITVDEKLDDNTVRLLVSPLIEGIEKFTDKKTKQVVITDRRRNWEEERDFIVERENFHEFLSGLGVQSGKIGNVDWEAIKEGRTCLLGQVRCKKLKRPVDDKNTKYEYLHRYIVDTKEMNLFWIDEEVKETIKRLYFSTLKGRRKHAVEH